MSRIPSDEWRPGGSEAPSLPGDRDISRRLPVPPTSPRPARPARSVGRGAPPGGGRRVHPEVGTLVEWDPEKGFGFLGTSQGRLFLHQRDFADRRRRPGAGDRIRFEVGEDAKGRRCAVRAVQLVHDGPAFPSALLPLLALLLLPALALSQCTIDWRWGGAYLLAINVLTYGTYGWDKRRARLQGWRFPEARLHLLELLGGWPGAYVAQRRFRHKIAKVRFLVGFWAIVAVYQLGSADFLFGWPAARAALAGLDSVLERSAHRP